MSDRKEVVQTPVNQPVKETSQNKRIATVYDVVAGRVGHQGFLNEAQIQSEKSIPSAPEEVLLRRLGAPDEIPFDYYNADQNLGQTRELPGSDLLKDLHSYVSDFYTATTDDGGLIDFRSMDETALLAMGILLEEMSREVLGENGDMVFVEPEGLDEGIPLSNIQKHQIVGRVIPQMIREYRSPSPPPEQQDDGHERRRKRRRFRLSDVDALDDPELSVG